MEKKRYSILVLEINPDTGANVFQRDFDAKELELLIPELTEAVEKFESTQPK